MILARKMWVYLKHDDGGSSRLPIIGWDVSNKHDYIALIPHPQCGTLIPVRELNRCGKHIVEVVYEPAKPHPNDT